MRIGSHLSVAAGFAKMIDKTGEIDANAVQYFPKNPKSYRPKKFDRAEYQAQAESAKAADVISVCHSPYVTNLSTSDPNLRKLTIESIINDLEIADAYGTDYLVVHCGKHVGQGEETGIALMVEALDEILARFDGHTQFLLENTAGQGSELGTTADQLLEVRGRIAQPAKLGFCFDTCHAFASGWLTFDDFEAFCEGFFAPELFAHIKVIHLNDSKFPAGSCKDRHERLGQGEIGEANMARFLSHEALRDRPIIIETPVDDELEYADEIAKARRWSQAEADRTQPA